MKHPARIIASGMVLLIALMVGTGYVLYRETNCLEINTFALRHPGLSRSLPGVKIAFLADLHIRNYGQREDRILAVLAQEKPDLILLAGDYIHFQGSYDPVLKFFERLNAPLGVYAVLGNTDYTNENGTCILCHVKDSDRLLPKSKPVFLRNDCITLERKDEAINLIGLDDPVIKRRKKRLNHDVLETMGKVDPVLPSILLSHSPEVMPDVAGQADLVLAGHNHGGQVRILRTLRQLLLPEPSYDYLEGFFRNGHTLLYVSRGIGRSSLPFRLGARPEITFFKIEGSHPDNGIDPVGWSEISSRTEYAGFDRRLFIECVNPLPYMGKRLRAHRWKRDPILFDFEHQSELRQLHRECGMSLDRVKAHATSGKYSLHARIRSGNSKGIVFEDFRSDWSQARYLKMDIFNPDRNDLELFLRIDDADSRDNPSDHLDRAVTVKSGMNRIGIPLDSLRTNQSKRALDLHAVEDMILYGAKQAGPLDFYLDHVRLESGSERIPAACGGASERIMTKNFP